MVRLRPPMNTGLADTLSANPLPGPSTAVAKHKHFKRIFNFLSMAVDENSGVSHANLWVGLWVDFW